MSFSVVTNYQTTLSAPMTSSQLTVPVNSIQTRDNPAVTLATADIGSNGWYLTISPNTSSEEILLVTAISSNGDGSGTYTVSAVGRGLAYSGTSDSQVTLNAKSHNAGEVVILSDVKNVYDRLVDKESNETIAGVKTFSSSPLVPTPTVLETTAAASVAYVNAIAIAGSPDASTTTKGISKLSTAAVSPTDPIVVGDNDTRVPTQSENNALVGNNTDIAVGTSNKFVTQTGLQKSAECYAVDAAGTDTYVVTLSPIPTSYAAGMTVRAKVATANIGASTLNVNGLGPIAITKNGGVATETNDIKAGQTLTFIYDTVGPKFEIQSLDKMSQANATTLTTGSTTFADTLHTHTNTSTTMDSFFGVQNTGTLAARNVGFSDATTKIFSYGYAKDTTDEQVTKALSLASDFGTSFYPTTTPTVTTVTVGGVENVGLVVIGTDIWTVDGNGTAGNRVRKNGTSVTISGTGVSTNGCLGHDPTNSYLLVLDSTTTIKRYSGIAGTTITFVDTITLDTAVSITGFVYDNTNSRYICLDTTNNIVRRFNSAGVTIDTAAYTVNDTNVFGLAILHGRVHLAVVTVYSTANGVTSNANQSCQTYLVPTTMTV